MSVTADDFSHVYTDFSELAALRAGAVKNVPSSIRDVAAQFEAVFLQMMLKSMQETSMGDPLLSGPGGRLYKDMFNQQVALQLASTKSIGLADVLTDQLAAVAEGDKVLSPVDAAAALAPVSRAAPSAVPVQFDTPRQFIEELLPHARRAAKQLGVDPGVLIAQSALETGWGQMMAKDAAGATSYNLFGIKATSNWAGGQVEVPTIEFDDGVMVKQRAPFRVYESIAHSFDDYVTLVRENPRYSDALTRASDPAAYITALQTAGYATDPSYADKVINIMRREEFDALKSSEHGPL